MSIDNTLHSLFGVSKNAGDLVQEYDKILVQKSISGYITGTAHSGTELHGFGNYLVKNVF